ncbi:MAG: helix-turn-helix transcriptional regulator [Oscillospiraceae bacterium]|nr:helix-turn-helix transcriptional regulator [Oscillospiraceae bacterium]
MPEKWTGELIGKMHNERVTLADLAAEAGWVKGYVSMILNGTRNPPGARERLENAFERVIGKRIS